MAMAAPPTSHGTSDTSPSLATATRQEREDLDDEQQGGDRVVHQVDAGEEALLALELVAAARTALVQLEVATGRCVWRRTVRIVAASPRHTIVRTGARSIASG